MFCGSGPSPLPSSEGSRHTRHHTYGLAGCLHKVGEGLGKPGGVAGDRDQRQLELGGQRESCRGRRVRKQYRGVQQSPVPRTAGQNPSIALAWLVT